MRKKRVLIKLQSGAVTVAAAKGVEWAVVDMNHKHQLPHILPADDGYEALASKLRLDDNHVYFHTTVREDPCARSLAWPLIAFALLALMLILLGTCQQHPAPAATEIVYEPA